MGIRARRRWFQLLGTLGMNIYLPAFVAGRIVQARSKGVCVPVLNCYSCPSAIGACPIGSLQHAFTSMRFKLALGEYQLGLYVLGFLGLVGSFVGRLPCGWLCPFGLLQEGLHKIPSPKCRIPRFLTYGRYLVLVVAVIGVPLLLVDRFGYGQPWFCKLICPAGTLEAGIPLALVNDGIRQQLGLLFVWKVAVLVAFLVWMVLAMRPFCRTVCPLGAILGLFNKASLFRLEVNQQRCTTCGRCARSCPIGIEVQEVPNSPECIRCLKCVDACDRGCISYELWGRRPASLRIPFVDEPR